MTALTMPKVGDKIILTQDADRFPHFIIKTGSTGTIIEATDDIIVAKMTNPFEGGESWEQSLQWSEINEMPLAQLFNSEAVLISDIPERIDRAASSAQDAFWAMIVQHFPEVTTGDFPPDATFEIERAMTEAVTRWILWNHPIHKEGDAA